MNTNKPAWWAWRFPDGKLSSPYKNHSLCTYLHEGHAGHLVSLVVQEEGQAQEPLTRETIRAIFMAHGFTIKEGQTDLKDYVYQAAEALLAAAHGIGVPTPAAVSIAEISVDELRRLMQQPPPIMPLLPIPAPPAVAAAVLAEREACAKLMADLREKSRNHLFRSALTVAEGEIRARGVPTHLPADDTEGG